MNTVQEYTIEIYTTADGKLPYAQWLSTIKDQTTVDRIELRLYRIRQGNLGDCKDLKGGIYELRLFFGPGYRIYFSKEGNTIILLLAGGTKRTQSRDIQRAREYYQDYLERKNG